MQIKIEIELKPEELRRFLGLPDVAGLQDDVVQFLRDKVGKVNENFNPADFLKGNLDLLRQSPAWKKLVTKINLGGEAEARPEEPPAKPARKRAPRRSRNSTKE
ncbi:MAG: DUF6489 family protein [Panacagrimonas sp.]